MWEFKFLGSYYRATYNQGSDTIVFEEQEEVGLFKTKSVWRYRYSGHTVVLKDIVEFANTCNDIVKKLI